MMSHRAPRTTHRWLVAKIEADVASIVGDGARRFHVPCSLLPDGVREDHMLDVVREESSAIVASGPTALPMGRIEDVIDPAPYGPRIFPDGTRALAARGAAA